MIKKIREYSATKMLELVAILALVLALLIPFVLAIYGRLASGGWPEWSGFGDYQPPVVGFQRAKTLWDWLALIVAPLMLALVGIVINSTIRKNESDREEIRAQAEKRNADERMMEDVLQSFLDKVDDLLINPKLYDLKDGDILRNIVRTRTITTLRRIDAKRKSILFQFLAESGLINKNYKFVIVDLSGADLEGVEIHGANLEGALLNGVNMKGARLDYCNLNGASLIEANLESAQFIYCQLENAKLNPDVPSARAQITNLCGASLSTTSFLNTELFGVAFDGNTILPDGKNWTPDVDLSRYTKGEW